MVAKLPIVLLTLALVTPDVSARKWTDRSGAFSVEAELVKADASSVTLRRSDGQTVEVPLARLSAADQQFVRVQLTQNRKKPPSTVERIDAALVAKSQGEFVSTPLASVLKFLAESHDIPILLDNQSLDDIGIAGDTPVTLQARDVAFSKLLDRILDPLELTWLVRHEVLWITTQEENEALAVPRVYKLIKPVDPDRLVDDLTTNIDPNSWEDVGGPASLEYVAFGAVVVSQTQQNHRKIQHHYKALLDCVLPAEPRIAEVPGLKIPQRQLLAKSTAEFIETPLQDAVDFLADRHGIEIRIDKRKLDDIGLGSDAPVTLNVKGISLASLLSILLARVDHELTFSADESGVLITTIEAAEGKLHLAGYRVADIIGGDFDSLIEIVTSTVEPASWDDVGGPATIRGGVRGTLDVRQTFQGHQLVSGLLDDLRTAKMRMR